MSPLVKEKINEMRLLISPKDLKWFQTNFPELKFQAGDTTIRWNANNKEETELARRAFEAYKNKHPQALFFKINREDKKDVEPLKVFDPNCEYIVGQEWQVKG